MFSVTEEAGVREEVRGVSGIQDKELKLEHVQAAHTLGAASETTRCINLADLPRGRVASRKLQTLVPFF